MKIRILYVLNNAFGAGGTEAVVLTYYKVLRECDYVDIEFAVHATEEEVLSSEITQKLLREGAIINRVTPRWVSIKKNKLDLERLFKSGGYDIVHAHTDAVSGLILKIAKKSGVKIRIAHCHNTGFVFKKNDNKKALKFIFLTLCKFYTRYYATDYMACSNTAAKWLFGTQKNVYILKNVIDTEKYAFNKQKRYSLRSMLGIKNEFVMGNVGRLNYQKNQLFLLDVFRIVHDEKKDSKLILIGEGDLRKDIEYKAKELGINDAVILYGETDDVAGMLSVMDVFTFPSRYEGFSIAIIEAQANGLHCFVNDTERVTKDSDLTGQVEWIATNSPDKWAKAILTSDYTRRSDAISKIIERGFDLKGEAEKLQNYYKGLYENNR